jgi:small conductance mechanosensitive channel
MDWESMPAGVMRHVRSHAHEVRSHAVARARRARAQAAVLAPAIAGVVLAYVHRRALFGLDVPVRIVCVVALVILGWAFARSLGGAVGPILMRRLEPGTAGTVGFLVRLATLIVTVLAALRLAGLRPQTLAVGGAITAVILGLAAQQTVGNLVAGTVLLSARPFRVGDRVRVHAGSVAGTVEGTVASLGLLYTTLANGADRIMVANNVVLAAAVVPLREPSGVDLRARLSADTRPSEVHRLLQEHLSVPTRSDPHVELEELDAGQVIFRVHATPANSADGPALADEVVAALDKASNGKRDG